MKLLDINNPVSQPFRIEGESITLLATELGTGEFVEIFIVALTDGGPAATQCCPGAVTLPEIKWSTPLKVSCNCGTPTAVVLTPEKPWVELHSPKHLLLQAKVTAADDAIVEVFLFN